MPALTDWLIVSLTVTISCDLQDLISTVGIHPTIGEEFTVMSVTKSSGASVAKVGC